jgi:hypothetical protein
MQGPLIFRRFQIESDNCGVCLLSYYEQLD